MSYITVMALYFEAWRSLGVVFVLQVGGRRRDGGCLMLSENDSRYS